MDNGKPNHNLRRLELPADVPLRSGPLDAVFSERNERNVDQAEKLCLNDRPALRARTLRAIDLGADAINGMRRAGALRGRGSITGLAETRIAIEVLANGG